MKVKILTILIGLVSIIGASAMNSVVLSHQGKVTVFDNGNFAGALEAAVANDTIFVPAITIDGFTLNKPVTIIGRGEDTKVSEDVKITIADKDLQIEGALLDGLYIEGTLNFVGTTAKGSWIRMCNIYRIIFDTGIELSDVVIERCRVRYLVMCQDKVSYALFKNCQIMQIQGTGKTANSLNLENCDVYYLGSSSNYPFRGYVTNSIIQAYYYSRFEGLAKNCLVSEMEGTYPDARQSNCIQSKTSFFSSSFTYNIAKDSIKDILLGTDGTIVGAFGGKTPFTLSPSIPFVKSADITVNAEDRTLSVDVTFTETAE